MSSEEQKEYEEKEKILGRIWRNFNFIGLVAIKKY